jgi:protocatechuate 3,4-dioxygenase beta subunit
VSVASGAKAADGDAVVAPNKTATITVRVADAAGAPVAGAEVRAAPRAWQAPARAARWPRR